MNVYDRLESDAVSYAAALSRGASGSVTMADLSSAISLKRIADALEKLVEQGQYLGSTIHDGIVQGVRESR